MRLLAGDVGGTNARFVLYDTNEINLEDVDNLGEHKIVSQMYYKNNDYSSFTDVLCTFLSLPGNRNIHIHACCLAVAGPVTDNHINFTNREGWIIDGTAIEKDFDIGRVFLVNDFVANGYGLLSLTEKELIILQEGKDPSLLPKPLSASRKPVAMVGAGTGLGECYLTPDSTGLLTAFPTEGGHVEFAPRTPLEEELLHWLQKKLSTEEPNGTQVLIRPRVSVERLLSGKGLENIYEFLRDRYPHEVDKNFDADYLESNERGKLIGSEKYNYSLFKRALEIMFAIYGGEVGNVALKFLPYGGLYIAGGIAPKNIEFINAPDSPFMDRFRDKGRVSSIMGDFPVYIVVNEDLGLRGAHIVASRLAAKAYAQSSAPVAVESKGEDFSKASLAANLRSAINDYPVTYAVASSLTAACTAAALSIGTQIAIRYKFWST